MGVYLSEPETTKNIVVGSRNELRFVSGEMQGTPFNIQGGEKIWRTPQFIRSILEMEIHSLQFLMVMEVNKLLFRT